MLVGGESCGLFSILYPRAEPELLAICVVLYGSLSCVERSKLRQFSFLCILVRIISKRLNGEILFCRMMLCKRGLCRHALSVRLFVNPSVYLSVTFVNSVKTNKCVFKIFSPAARLYRDVVGRWSLVGWLVGWLSRSCTVAKRCILGL